MLKSMCYEVSKKYGLESKVAIEFCRLAEKVEREGFPYSRLKKLYLKIMA